MRFTRQLTSMFFALVTLIGVSLAVVAAVARQGTTSQLAWTLALGLAAILVACLWAASRVARHLRLLQSILDDVAAGRSASSSTFPPGSEIAELSARIEGMRQSLSAENGQLVREREILEGILMAMPEGVIAVDVSGQVLFANRAAQLLFEGTLDRIGLRETNSTALSRLLGDVQQRVVANKAPVRDRTETSQDGQSTFSVYAVPLSGSRGSEVVFLVHDDTENVQAETLRQEFVANVSHELKTPLSSIKAYAETLRAGAIEDPHNNVRFVARIEEQTDRLHQLILDLLQIARIESGKQSFDIRSVDLGSIVDVCLDNHRDTAAAKGIDLNCADGDRTIKVRADEEGLRQIVDNLVDNAVKYTSAEGTVSVDWDREGAYARLAIRDSGIGIPEEHLGRLFERFYRVDKARSRELGGTGLGLSIVKHLAQSFGGGVTVESTAGKGSTFYVDLPCM